MEALTARHSTAKTLLLANTTADGVASLQNDCDSTSAVMNCPLMTLFNGVVNCDIWPTYRHIESLRNRQDFDSAWDWQKLRPHTEIDLLGSCGDNYQLHYAALSTTGRGLRNYGVCSITLRTQMIASRASCFECNSAVFWRESRDIPCGMRSDWGRRGMLCLAKLAPKLHSGGQILSLAAVLLVDGDTGLTDDFIEVHVFGDITAFTFESIRIDNEAFEALCLANPDNEGLIRGMWRECKSTLVKSGVEVVQ